MNVAALIAPTDSRTEYNFLLPKKFPLMKGLSNMIHKRIALGTALLLCFGAFSAGPASAQTTGESRQTGVSEHHQRQYELMRDMSEAMSKMAQEMARGDLTSDKIKHMRQRMERMSKMMRRMSGLLSRPAMKEPEMKKQMAQMRKEMDEMMGDPAMRSPLK